MTNPLREQLKRDAFPFLFCMAGFVAIAIFAAAMGEGL